MNPALQSLFARRSVREYTDQEISDETIKDILEAAMAAPSAVAKDPWHFIIVKDAAMRERIAAGLPNGTHLRQAPVGIVVCGDINEAHGGELSYLLQDCAAAIENLLLAASMLGLGACWLGVHPRPERGDHLRHLFGLPRNIIPVSVVSLGRPGEELPARTRLRPTSTHWEKW
jgi:nitroreductase